MTCSDTGLVLRTFGVVRLNGRSQVLGQDQGLVLHFTTAKHFEGAVGSAGLYIGLQRAYLCLSQYETNCLEK